jgi:hypothetical protein
MLMFRSNEAESVMRKSRIDPLFWVFFFFFLMGNMEPIGSGALEMSNFPIF